MSGIVSFRDLDAWKVAMDLVVSIYLLASRLPPSERYELSPQMRKAAVSIPSNIAEGQAFKGARHLYHVFIALGSLAEVDTQLELAARLGLLSAADVAALRPALDRTGKLLHGLARSLTQDLAKKAVKAVAGSAGVLLVACLLLMR